MARTWDNITESEAVSYDEVNQAIADNYLAQVPGQILESGSECIASVQAEGWLRVDPDFMPSAEHGELPVKSNFIPLPANVRFVLSETNVTWIDVNLFVSLDNNNFIEPYSNFDQTYSIKGGTLLTAVVTSVESTTATNPLKHLRITRDGIVIMDQQNTTTSDILIGHERLLAGSDYLIEVYGSGDAPVVTPDPAKLIYTNNSGYDISYAVYNTDAIGENPVSTGSLTAGQQIDIVTLIPGPSGNRYVLKFLTAKAGRYTFSSTSGLTVTNSSTVDNQVINTLTTSDVSMALANGERAASITYSNLPTKSVKLQFYTSDGYPPDHAYVQIMDWATQEIVQIVDYGTGVPSDRKYNPYSYDISYFKVTMAGQYPGSYVIIFKDTATFSGSGDYKGIIEIPDTTTSYPLYIGRQFEYGPLGSSTDDNHNPIKVRIKKN